MDEKSSNIAPAHDEHLAMKSEVDEATGPVPSDRRQATALNIVENPLMVCHVISSPIWLS